MPTPNAIVPGLHFSRVPGVPFLAEEGIEMLGVGGPLQLPPRHNPSASPVPQHVVTISRRKDGDGLSRPDSYPDC